MLWLDRQISCLGYLSLTDSGRFWAVTWRETWSSLANVHEQAVWFFFGGAIVLGLLLRAASRVWQRLRPTAPETIWCVEILRLASWLVILLGAGWTVHGTNWHPRVRETIVATLTALGIVLAARAVVRLGTAVLQHHWTRWFAGLPPITLVQVVIALTVYTIALLMVLHQFGLSITPLLTAVGVGGLAVALGIQDTLSNLFAGISITLARLIRPGDYLRLENGLEGTVQDIGWRYTTLRTQQHTLVVVPNSRLSQLIVTNFCLPDMRTLVQIPITLPSVEDALSRIAELERILHDALEDFPQVLREPAPRLRIVGITERGLIQVQVQLWLRDPLQLNETLDELYRRLLYGLQPKPQYGELTGKT